MNVQLVCQWVMIVLYAMVSFVYLLQMVGSDKGVDRASGLGGVIGSLVGIALVYGAGGFSLTLEQWFK
jgi:hypothetical protein